ncbi:hypothetical protein QP174_10430 [Sphingomonas aerolata]
MFALNEIAAVDLGARVAEAADGDARPFGREVIGIGTGREAADRHARHALQRFGDRTIGQRADVFGRDRIAHDFGIALDRLRTLQALADAGDDDVLIGGFVLRRCGRLLGLRHLGTARGHLPVGGGLCRARLGRPGHGYRSAIRRCGTRCCVRRLRSLAGGGIGLLSQSAVWRGGQAQRKQGGTTFEEVPATRGACDLELGHDSWHPLIVLALSFVSAFFLQCLVARGMSSA